MQKNPVRLQLLRLQQTSLERQIAALQEELAGVMALVAAQPKPYSPLRRWLRKQRAEAFQRQVSVSLTDDAAPCGQRRGLSGSSRGVGEEEG